MALQSINPANDVLLQEYAETTPSEVRAALQAAATGPSSAWRESTFADRAAPMRRAAALLRERKDDLARLMALEMGKPLAQGRAEAEKCAWVCDYYADQAEGFLGRKRIATDASRSFVAFGPLGVVLAVMPWNFPLWQVFRFVAPGLMAGNAGVLKHSSNVSGCALAIEEIVLAAGFPQGLFRTLLVPVEGGGRHHRVARGEGGDPHRLARPPAARWPPPPGACSRRRCSSWGAATPT